MFQPNQISITKAPPCICYLILSIPEPQFYFVQRKEALEINDTEYYTEVHLHCFLRKLYSS